MNPVLTVAIVLLATIGLCTVIGFLFFGLLCLGIAGLEERRDNDY